MSAPALTALLAGLRPSELALWDWVAPRLDASMVDGIAAADYGTDAAEHRRHLDQLRRVRRLPEELSWHPEEVLALTRWSTVDDARHDPTAARRQHLVRMFSCLLLIHATTTLGTPVNSLTPLVESAVELGPDAYEPARRYLAWCRLREPGDWRDDPAARPMLTLALVTLSSLPPADHAPDLPPDLVPGLLATFVDDLSAALAGENLLWTPSPMRELLTRTAMAGSRRIWISLAERILIDGPARHGEHGVALAHLGRALRGDLTADVEQLRELLVR